MPKSHSEKVLLNAGSGFVVKLVDQLMKFVLKTVFIYTLGIQYTGVSTLFTDILNMLALAELGIGHAITFALYKPIKEQDHARIAALMNFYKTAYRLIAGFVLIAGLCCLPFLPYMVRDVPDIRENISLIFVLYVVNSASSYLLVYKSTLLTASERRYVISKVNIVFSFLRMVMECVVLLLFKNFILYLLIGIVESLCRNFVISKRADHYFPELSGRHDEKMTGEETKRLLGDVGALALYRMCNIVLNSTDSIVIAAAPALGVISVGFLGNYRMLVNTVDSVITQFFYSVTPSLGTMAVGNTGERQYQVFRTMNFITFWCACFCSASLLSLSTPFITDIWLGKKYVLPMSILGILVLNLYINTMTRPCNSVRNANGLFVEGYYRPVIMAVLNIGLDLLLVRPMGVAGVLLATGIARVSTQLWYDPWLAYARVFRKPFLEYVKSFCAYTFVTLLACALTFFLCRGVGVVGNVYCSFLLKVLICLLVPNLLVILFFHRTPEFHDFKKRLMRMGKKASRAVARRRNGVGKGKLPG